jgi:hypothetical protein
MFVATEALRFADSGLKTRVLPLNFTAFSYFRSVEAELGLGAKAEQTF